MGRQVKHHYALSPGPCSGFTTHNQVETKDVNASIRPFRPVCQLTRVVLHMRYAGRDIKPKFLRHAHARSQKLRPAVRDGQGPPMSTA